VERAALYEGVKGRATSPVTRAEHCHMMDTVSRQRTANADKDDSAVFTQQRGSMCGGAGHHPHDVISVNWQQA